MNLVKYRRREEKKTAIISRSKADYLSYISQFLSENKSGNILQAGICGLEKVYYKENLIIG